VGADEFFFMKPFYSRNRVPQFLKRVGPIRFPWRGSALLSAASRSLARRQRLRITWDPRLRLCRAEVFAFFRGSIAPFKFKNFANGARTAMSAWFNHFAKYRADKAVRAPS